jgi:hypothetical protein
METPRIRTLLLAVFPLALLACDNSGPSDDPPSENLLGFWAPCFDSVKCRSVRDDAYRISADSIARVELSGFEHTEFASAECAKCAKTTVTAWKYETDTPYAYTRRGDSLSFSPATGETVTLMLSGPGKIKKASLHVKAQGRDTVLTAYWTRLSGTFTEFN